jgi:hypothetical protein
MCGAPKTGRAFCFPLQNSGEHRAVLDAAGDDASQCREMAKKLPSERAALLKMPGAWEAVARDAAKGPRDNRSAPGAERFRSSAGANG